MEPASLAITLDDSHAYWNVGTTALEWGLWYLMENNPRSLSCHPAAHQLGLRCRFLLMHSISVLLYWLGYISQVFPNSYSVVLVYRMGLIPCFKSNGWKGVCWFWYSIPTLPWGFYFPLRQDLQYCALHWGKHTRSPKCMSFRNAPFLEHKKVRISVKVKTRFFFFCFSSRDMLARARVITYSLCRRH